MTKYKCTFRDEYVSDGEEAGFEEYDTYNHADAARQYAEYAHDNRNMCEVKSPWGTKDKRDYNIVVINTETKEMKEFMIEVDYEPVFGATENILNDSDEQ